MSRYTVHSPSRYRAVTVDGQTRVQATAAMRGPAGQPGKPGEPGKDGPEGRPGRDADVTMARMMSRRPLTRLLKALQDSGNAVIAVQGDSKSAGIAVSDRSKRWQELIRDDLRLWYAPTGDAGVGVIQCYNFADNYVKPQPTIGGERDDSGQKDWAYIADGLGYQSVQLDTADAVVTFPSRSVRYLRVHWTRKGDGGKFVVKNGSATVGEIDTAGQAGEAWTDYDLGSVAARTITLTQTEGHPRISALVYRTATTGVTVIDAAHSGARADEYANKPANVQAVQAWAPAVLVIALGANDLSTKQTANGMADSLAEHLGQHWAVNPKMAVLFIFSPPRWQNVDPQDPDYDPTRWAKVRSAVGSAIGDDPRVQIWDEASFFMPGPDSEGLKDPWDLTVFNDAVHYQDFGNRMLADGIMREAFTSDVARLTPPRMSWGQSTADYTVTGTAANVPGLQIVITPTVAGRITIHAPVHVTIKTAGDRVQLRCTQNGSNLANPIYLQSPTADLTATVTGAWVTAVTAGVTYTYRITAQRSAGSGTSDVVGAGSSITYEFLPNAG